VSEANEERLKSYAPIRTNTIAALIPTFVSTVTGFGEITNLDKCGKWGSVAACNTARGQEIIGDDGKIEKHYVRHLQHSCDNPTCPICMPRWTRKEGARLSTALRGYQVKALGEQVFEYECDEDYDCSEPVLDATEIAWHKYNAKYLNHYMLSPLLSVVPREMGIDEIKALGKAMATRVGVTGGVMVFHPYRIKKYIQKCLSKYCVSIHKENFEGREKKFWELLRENVLNLKSWREYIEWSPHYHIVGFGRILSQRTIEEKMAARIILNGWVARWIRHVDTRIWFDGQDIHDPIAELAAYLLSHAGHVPGKKIPMRFGVMSSHRLEKVGKPNIIHCDVICPECKSPVIICKAGIDGDLIPLPRRNEYGNMFYRLKYQCQRYVILPWPPDPPIAVVAASQGVLV
jgi:hypothetical protein